MSVSVEQQVEEKASQVELDSRVLDIRRTTKVVKGGRTFSFSALVVVGDSAGSFGCGRGKAKEVTTAIQKATDNARKNMNKVDLVNGTLQHAIYATYGATRIIMKPAPEGTGIIAGGAMRDLFEVLGMRNVSAKTIGSSSPTNVVNAVSSGLLSMASPESIARKRGKTVEEIMGKSE